MQEPQYLADFLNEETANAGVWKQKLLINQIYFTAFVGFIFLSTMFKDYINGHYLFFSLVMSFCIGVSLITIAIRYLSIKHCQVREKEFNYIKSLVFREKIKATYKTDLKLDILIIFVVSFFILFDHRFNSHLFLYSFSSIKPLICYSCAAGVVCSDLTICLFILFKRGI